MLTEQVEEAAGKLGKAQQEVEEFNKVSGEVTTLNNEQDGIQSELKAVGKGISTTQATMNMLKKEVDELETKIETKEKERKLADKLKEYHMWFEEFLIPTLDTIEKHVMLSINQEFNQNFQKWWSMLVPSTPLSKKPLQESNQTC